MLAITRINTFEAKAGSEEDLYRFLQSVISRVTACPGSISCQLLRSTDSVTAFAIIEEWDDVESHQKAARAIPPEMMAQAGTLFAKPPSGSYYTT